MFKNTNEFFEEVAKKELLKIDIENYLMQVTNNYNLDKLNLLIEDLNSFMDSRYSSYLKQFTFDEILEMTEKVKEAGEDPYNYPDFIKDDVKLFNKVKKSPVDSRWFIDPYKVFGFDYEIYMMNISKLKTKIISTRDKQISAETHSIHDHIFANNGFKLFELLLENYIGVIGKGRHMDINYFYRRMRKDKYISVSATEFRNWYNDVYKENYQLKTEIETKTGDNKRFNNYSFASSQFKKK